VRLSRALSLLAAIAVVAGVLSVTGASAKADDTCTVATFADTYVSEHRPNTNFGTADTIQTDARAGRERRGLLKFNVQCIPPGATNVTVRLRLFAAEIRADWPRLGAYIPGRPPSSWTSTTVTWNTAPGADGFIGLTRLVEGRWAEIDVSSHVNANGITSLLLIDESRGDDGGVNSFWSQTGNGGETRPNLQVTYTPAPPAPDPRPMPGAEPGPSRADCQALPHAPESPVRTPDRATVYETFEGDNQQIDLGFPPSTPDRTYWTDAPTGLRYPLRVGILQSAAVSGNTCILGGEIRGNLDPGADRVDLYDAYHSGIEHSATAGTFAVADGIRVDNFFDGYRKVGSGTGYLKRAYFTDLKDDCIENEVDELGAHGGIQIYDSLMECYSGISDDGDQAAPASKTVLDGVLLWIKPTKDRVSPNACRGDQCGELADGTANAEIWKGLATSTPTVEVHNTWFRLDEASAWNLSAMAFPCTPLSSWGATSCVYDNVKVLWTGAGPYPGPELPAGVTLVTGQDALDQWNAAAADWKADHGY
jgi:hypothetical protein